MYEKGELEDAYLFNIMWSLASRPSKLLTLLFEDFEDIVNQKVVYYYANKMNQRMKFTISDEFFNQVMEFNEFKLNHDKY